MSSSHMNRRMAVSRERMAYKDARLIRLAVNQTNRGSVFVEPRYVASIQLENGTHFEQKTDKHNSDDAIFMYEELPPPLPVMCLQLYSFFLFLSQLF